MLYIFFYLIHRLNRNLIRILNKKEIRYLYKPLVSPMNREREMKPLLPVLREKNRYLCFEIISDTKSFSKESVSSVIEESLINTIGLFGASKAHARFVKYEHKLGMIKVTRESLDNARASLTMIREIKGKNVIFNTLGISGILNIAYKKYFKNEVGNHATC
jgi:ribonuclease P/MRP protein subunit POP5